MPIKLVPTRAEESSESAQHRGRQQGLAASVDTWLALSRWHCSPRQAKDHPGRASAFGPVIEGPEVVLTDGAPVKRAPP